MMKKRKLILFIALACCLIAVGAICYMMYMPHKSIEHETPVIVTSVELVEAYQKDEPAANHQFLDKVLQVTGVIEGLETNNDGQTVVTLSGSSPLSGVRCTLQKNATLEAGVIVTLKGRCTGYLSDVVLIDCLLIDYIDSY